MQPLWKWSLGTLAGLSVILAVLILIAVSSPDRDLTFIREVPSKPAVAPRSYVERAFDNVANWPDWFHNVADAKLIDIAGRPYSLKDQGLIQGAVVKIWIDPHKGSWKKYEITAEVLAYEPKHLIHLKVLGDSRGKLNRLFDRLEWKIELLEKTPGRLFIRGTTTAHTRHWRSRFFGMIAERILLNQVTVPDVILLAELKQPQGGASALSPQSQY